MPILPVEIEKAIEDQRRVLVTAITLLHSLHSTLRRQTGDIDEIESEAIGWVELADLTAMLLERVHSVHFALDSVSLRQAFKASKL